MTYADFVDKIIEDFVSSYIVPILFAAGVAYFLLGTLKFVQSAGDSKGREEGKKRMMYGLIGLAVMASVWGLVSIIAGTFGINEIGIPQF